MGSVLKSIPRICVALGQPDAESLGRAAELEIRDGNVFLEFRLDQLTVPLSGLSLIERLRQQYPELYILTTCRHKANSGGFGGTIDGQLEILRRAGEAGAQLIDLEIESALPLKKSLRELRESAALVISYHNFESTPALNSVLSRMRKVGADAYKIVTTAKKPSDILRMMEFQRTHKDAPLIAFAMSEVGVPSRILSLAAGSVYTYAAPVSGEGTAPGQIQARLMRGLYHADKLSKHSRIFGVIADPVAHSRSPQVHNRAFHAKRIDAAYLPFRVTPSTLADWMKLANGLPVAGFSVTIPHKQRIMRYLDVIDPMARRIGAVNTVWRKGGRWRGANTDVVGVLRPLERWTRLAGARVLIAGYGGAARAAAFALKDAGARLTISGRKLQQAQALANAVGAEVQSLKMAETQMYDVLVNATPLGMHPWTDQSVFSDRIPAKLVFDMVYNPHETRLLQTASQQGCKIIHGCEMFIEQAAEQFEIWTGETAPRPVMRQSLEL